MTILALSCRAQVETHTYVAAETPATRPAMVVLDDTDPLCLSTFEGTLSPYGEWIDDPISGWVWVPDPLVVGVGFRPYVDAGHWGWTEHGYFWVSDHGWGWVTFHYGRWEQNPRWGWVWIPGARYSPAWVDWRHGGGWIGWAPTRPTFHWRDGVAVMVDAPAPPWVFVHATAMFAPYLSVVLVAPAHRDLLLGSTTRWLPGGPSDFRGPPPTIVGIPRAEVDRASRPVPGHVLPQAVPWGRMPPPPPKAPKPKPMDHPNVAPVPPELGPSPKPAPPPPQVVPKPAPKDVVPLPPPKAQPKPKAKPAPTPVKPKPGPAGPKPFS